MQCGADESAEAKASTETQHAALVQLHSPYRHVWRCHAHPSPRGAQVVRFATAFVKAVVPLEFWGSKHNEALIFAAIATFVRMTRYERFSVHAALRTFRCGADPALRAQPTFHSITDCAWLRTGEHESASAVNARVLFIKMLVKAGAPMPSQR